LALALGPGDGRGTVGAAAFDLLDPHLPLLVVRQPNDRHAEVQQGGVEREDRAFLPAICVALDVNTLPILPIRDPLIQSSPVWSRKLRICPDMLP
jgi:hypothetical protein